MPCLSLMHRKIYQITVAKRIAARRLASATQKKAQKSAQKAAKKAAKAQTKNQAPAAPITPVAVPVPSSAPAQPTALSTLQSKLIAMAEKPSSEIALTTNPAFRIISTTLQTFEEGIVVRVPHTRAASILEQNVVVAAPAAQSASILAPAPAATVPTPAATTQAPRRLSFFHRRPTRAELINAESSFGRTLFGPIPAGHRREFFHDRDNVWIWYESWTGVNREAHQLTVRYEVRPTGVYKKLAAGNYATLEGSELENFRQAAHAYLYLIKRNLYHLA